MSSEAGSSTLQKVADAAEEFVEKMMDTESPPNESNEEQSGGKLTLEQRKAKMEQLRKKLVCYSYFNNVVTSLNHSRNSVHLNKPTELLS